MLKKAILCLTALLLFGGLLTACSNEDIAADDSDQISIVCTIFPQYDWVREIIAGKSDRYDLTLLLDSGVDLHNYQPTADDMVKISQCDLFIYVGGESDGWVDDALAEAVNDEMVVINLLDALGNAVKEEEVVEGMEAEEEEEAEGEEEGPEYDEHVWLSLPNAALLCAAIAEAVAQLDPAQAEDYAANAQAYAAKLSELDGEYQTMVDSAARDTVLFGDRFPFRYLVDDYGLDYYAAFVGCSAETEASFETIVFLANKVDQLGLDSVLVIENSDQSIAETVISNTVEQNQSILVMDSLQSVTAEDIADGTTYLAVMRSNLEVLTEALN